MNVKFSSFDVVILGAGWSGLMACKYSLAEGLTTAVLESRDTIGGVWAFTDSATCGSVMTTTETTSSRCVTEISDFPMPDDYPEFPSHRQILEYLESYCARFDLRRHIRLNQQVNSVKKAGDFWHISCTDGSVFCARNIVICSGVHQCPNEVSGDDRFRSFSGQILHSSGIKSVQQEYAGKTVVIWGGGESASDITFQISKTAAKIYWCIPNGQWFIPKIVERWPPFRSKRPKVGDQASSRVRILLSPTFGFSPFINQYLQYALGFNGHGQQVWKTRAPYHQSFFNKSYEVLVQVKSGKVIPKRDVSYTDGNEVYFDDGTSTRAERIITCSGYRTTFPFLDIPEAPRPNPQNWYKYLFADDPSLAFIGFARPVIGSIPAIAELQSRYAALVFLLWSLQASACCLLIRSGYI
jgi:dimethylaniline monooxygenase (N-oxide forming)